MERLAVLSARTFLFLGLMLGCLSCSKRLEPSECDELLDRYVGLLVTSDRPGTSETEVLRLKQRTRERALAAPAFARCPFEVSRSQFECAMQAANVDRLEQCLL